METITMINDRLINISEMSAILCLSKSSIYNFINEGKLPYPVKIGRSSRWRLSEVIAAIGNLQTHGRAA
jgi:predicted DNA-binding transcriptional regulator AlpA